MHKKDAPYVTQKRFNVLVKHGKINSVFGVSNVLKLFSGKILATKDIVNNIGSNYGSLRATALDNLVIYPDTAALNLKTSSAIGSIKRPKNISVIKNTNILSMTAPIFTKTAVSSIS